MPPVIPVADTARHPCQHKQLNIHKQQAYNSRQQQNKGTGVHHQWPPPTCSFRELWQDYVIVSEMILQAFGWYWYQVFAFFFIFFLIYCSRSDSSALVIWQKVTGSHMPFHCVSLRTIVCTQDMDCVFKWKEFITLKRWVVIMTVIDSWSESTGNY